MESSEALKQDGPSFLIEEEEPRERGIVQLAS